MTMFPNIITNGICLCVVTGNQWSGLLENYTDDLKGAWPFDTLIKIKSSLANSVAPISRECLNNMTIDKL